MVRKGNRRKTTTAIIEILKIGIRDKLIPQVYLKLVYSIDLSTF